MTDKPTRDQILAEPAGRQMDAWVAEFVMGHSLMRWINHPDFEPRIIDKPPELNVIPNYSTDIAAAWQVVEKMRNLDHAIGIDIYGTGEGRSPKRRTWGVRILDIQTFEIEADTAPLAICRAALLAALDGDTPALNWTQESED